jgi:3-oxoacyl-[acyl-carrier protein] reductase
MKYALVTGGSRGIGLQIAKKLLSKNYYVIINYFQDNSFIDQLINEGYDSSKISIIRYDNSNLDDLYKFTDEVERITKKLDLIVFNTGITKRCNLKEISKDDLYNVYGCNVFFPILFLSKVSEILAIKANIIFIGSILAVFPHSTSLLYGTSKSTVNSLTKNLVKYYVEKKIRVNCVNPGFINTDWHTNKQADQIKSIKNKIALKEFGSTTNVANLVYHIVTNDYINGAVINIDGSYNYE